MGVILMSPKKSLIIKTAFYLALWVFVIAAFFTAPPGNEMGMVITYFWLVIPVVTCIIAMLMETDIVTICEKSSPAVSAAKRNVIMILSFGIMSMLLPMLIFGLAGGGGINGVFAYFPDSVGQLIAGAVAAAVGAAVGNSVTDIEDKKKTRKRVLIASAVIIGVPVLLAAIVSLGMMSEWDI
jgi:hypothetical protein